MALKSWPGVCCLDKRRRGDFLLLDDYTGAARSHNVMVNAALAKAWATQFPYYRQDVYLGKSHMAGGGVAADMLTEVCARPGGADGLCVCPNSTGGYPYRVDEAYRKRWPISKGSPVPSCQRRHCRHTSWMTAMRSFIRADRSRGTISPSFVGYRHLHRLPGSVSALAAFTAARRTGRSASAGVRGACPRRS